MINSSADLVRKAGVNLSAAVGFRSSDINLDCKDNYGNTSVMSGAKETVNLSIKVCY
jgi:hypothetical protein